jgi:hypothetical protein
LQDTRKHSAGGDHSDGHLPSSSGFASSYLPVRALRILLKLKVFLLARNGDFDRTFFLNADICDRSSASNSAFGFLSVIRRQQRPCRNFALGSDNLVSICMQRRSVDENGGLDAMTDISLPKKFLHVRNSRIKTGSEYSS